MEPDGFLVNSRCYGVNCVSPNSNAEALTPNVTCWRWDLWKVIRVWMKSWGWGLGPYDGISALIRRDTRELPPSFSTTWGCKKCGHLQASKRVLIMKKNQPAPWSWTSQLPDLWEINSCCFSHTVCGILLWKPEQTKTLRLKPLKGRLMTGKICIIQLLLSVVLILCSSGIILEVHKREWTGLSTPQQFHFHCKKVQGC